MKRSLCVKLFLNCFVLLGPAAHAADGYQPLSASSQKEAAGSRVPIFICDTASQECPPPKDYHCQAQTVCNGMRPFECDVVQMCKPIVFID